MRGRNGVQGAFGAKCWCEEKAQPTSAGSSEENAHLGRAKAQGDEGAV